MKKFFKWVLIAFALFFVIGIIAVATGGTEETKETQDAQPKEETPAPKEEPKKEEPKSEETVAEPKEETGVKKEDYESIAVGDALTGDGGTDKQTVLDMFGKETSQMDVSSGEYSSTTYTWMDADFNAVTVTFTNDKVSSKLWSE
jgi:outer membrane biosynthesis protein TonB